MKCEICGDNEARKEAERCPITGAEWYMCEECIRFYNKIDKEMRENKMFNDFDFSHDELEEDNG